MVSQQIGIGVLLAGWDLESRLTPEGVAVLEAAAAHAASALDRARLFQELRREEQRLRSLIEAIPQPVLVVDTTTRTVAWTNQEARSLLGDVRGQSGLGAGDALGAVTLGGIRLRTPGPTTSTGGPPRRALGYA